MRQTVTGVARMNSYLAPREFLSSAITTSTHDLGGLQAAQLVASPPPPTPAVIVTGNITRIPDAPGITVVPPRLLSSAVQFDAVRSAANNTAIAYGLDPIYAADRATIEQLTLERQTYLLQPPQIITQVVLPD